MTQEELADGICSTGTLSKIENGIYYCVEAEQEGTNISEHTFIPNSDMRFRRVI